MYLYVLFFFFYDMKDCKYLPLDYPAAISNARAFVH